MANLGFVGLGGMGGRIAARLLAAGHGVVGFNRTRQRADRLAAAGLVVGDSPRHVAEASDVVFTMVTDGGALRAVTEGPDGILAGLGPGKVYVDMSTCSPAASAALAEEVDRRGAAMLEAPVSGSVTTLEEGRLAVMVGGDRTVYDAVRPILLDIGPTVNYVGSNGQALTMKIAINLSLAVQMLAFSEGVLIAEASGIDRATAVQVMMNSVIASPMIKYRGPLVLEPAAEVWFDCTMMQKDLLLALEAGRAAGVPLPTTAATNELLSAARGMGLEKQDFAILHEVLRRMSGRGSAASAPVPTVAG